MEEPSPGKDKGAPDPHMGHEFVANYDQKLRNGDKVILALPYNMKIGNKNQLINKGGK